ncbi:MAG: DNA translocase FtsK 4TM domain-containing protein [Patescibacteria group bacterium]
MSKVKKKRAKKAEPEADKGKQPKAHGISTETQKGIIIVLLFLFAGLSLLSFFDVAGPFGSTFNHYLSLMFGWGRFSAPVMAAILGYVLIYPEQYQLRFWHYIGLGLFILSFFGLIHIWLQPDLQHAASQGLGGGYMGVILSLLLLKTVGLWAGAFILLGLLVISILVVFNMSLERLLQRMPASSLLGRMRDWFKQRFVSWRHQRQQADFEDEEETEQIEPSEEDLEFAKRELEDAKAPAESVEPEQMELKLPKRHYKKVDFPMDLLNLPSETPVSHDIEQGKEKIAKTLANFGIDVEMADVNVGPTVTQFTLKPSEGVKLSQITTLQNDLSLALAAHPIRLEAPIPGKSLVGIEVPNHATATVTLREILDSKQFRRRKDNLTLPFGKDVAGEPYFYSLQKMPHLLIAGATGSGKSVCINIALISLIAQNSPEELKFILVDPKRVELSVYNKIPYLLTPVITEVDKTVNALRWCVAEMDRRYQILSDSGHRNIEAYNLDNTDDKLAYIILVIDELADLMSVAANEVEAAIVRLAQMSRAVGIHLILATQRPSVNVITGLIKANMPARAAFAVTSQIDSRTILDVSGAEKLLGRGDMLFTTAELSKPRRLQGAFLSDSEIERVCEFVSKQGHPEFNQAVVNKQKHGVMPQAFQDSGAEDDLLEEAKKVILHSGKASASLLQRRLRVGYARAARLLDILEEQGFIGPADGAKPREILSLEASATNGGMEFETADEQVTTDEEGEEKDQT